MSADQLIFNLYIFILVIERHLAFENDLLRTNVDAVNMCTGERVQRVKNS